MYTCEYVRTHVSTYTCKYLRTYLHWSCKSLIVTVENETSVRNNSNVPWKWVIIFLSNFIIVVKYNSKNDNNDKYHWFKCFIKPFRYLFFVSHRVILLICYYFHIPFNCNASSEMHGIEKCKSARTYLPEVI
jgi:hypothetical protein